MTNIKFPNVAVIPLLNKEFKAQPNGIIVVCGIGRSLISYSTYIAIKPHDQDVAYIRDDWRDFSNTTSRHTATFVSNQIGVDVTPADLRAIQDGKRTNPRIQFKTPAELEEGSA